jgi:hypothetical protein
MDKPANQKDYPMKNKITATLIPALAAWLLTSALCLPAFAQGTAFTYQGRLNDGGNPAGGIYDLRFTLYDAASVGTQQGGTVDVPDAPVTNGLFTVTLDFGGGVFTGAARWLDIAVRPGASVGTFTNLVPRQPITATPYAITAGNLSGALPSASLSGAYANAVTLNNGANSFSGNGANLTALNASQLGSGTVPAAALSNAWRIGGNAGTTPGTQFVGTTDNQPLEFKVNGTRALRLEPMGFADTVNVIGGSARNFVGMGAVGATIGGGGAGNSLFGNAYTNRVDADFGTVSGGAHNTIQAYAEKATIGGGSINTIRTNAEYATIGGGVQNTIETNALYATIAGGDLNTASGQYATVPGGVGNTAGGQFSFAAGHDAKALHDGAFVWSDSPGGTFGSTASNQFLIRAGGGVGIGTPNPQGSLHVYSANNPTVVRIQSAGTPGFGRVEFVSNPQGDANEWRPGFIQSTDNGGFTGGLAFFVNGTGAGNKFGSNEVMRVVNGAVGINTNDPSGAALAVNGGIKVFAGNTLEFGAGVSGKDANAGKIGYQSFTFGSLDIVGAGTSTSNRKIQFYCEGGATFNGTISAPSDRNLKQDFQPLDGREVLAKVAALPIQSWAYKYDASKRHIGPVAQDFQAAFGLNGGDDKSITTVDADGVALAAIQGLNQKVEETLKEKDARITALETELAKLKQMVEKLANQKN